MGENRILSLFSSVCLILQGDWDFNNNPLTPYSISHKLISSLF